MSRHQQVPVISHDLDCHHPPPTPGGFRRDQPRTAPPDPASKDRAAALQATHHVIPKATDTTCGNLHLPGHAGDCTHSLCQTTRFRCRPKTALPSRGA